MNLKELKEVLKAVWEYEADSVFTTLIIFMGCLIILYFITGGGYF